MSLADVLDLSVSLNPVAPDAGAVVAGQIGAIDRYPDPAVATATLAAAIGVDPDLLVLTNGAEAIALLAAIEREGAIVYREFSLYRRHLARVGVRTRPVVLEPVEPGGLARPARRSGVGLGRGVLPPCGRRVDPRRCHVVAHRLADEGLELPGLRIGYAIAPDPDLAAESRCQPRWSVNGLALAVVEALAAESDPPTWTATVATLRPRLVAALTGCGLDVVDTDSCWVLVHRPGLRELLAPHGIVVRDCTSFGLCGVARVAVPDDDGRARLDLLERITF